MREGGRREGSEGSEGVKGVNEGSEKMKGE
jgi:hypothetical protein